MMGITHREQIGFKFLWQLRLVVSCFARGHDAMVHSDQRYSRLKDGPEAVFLLISLLLYHPRLYYLPAATVV